LGKPQQPSARAQAVADMQINVLIKVCHVSRRLSVGCARPGAGRPGLSPGRR
jgi:hypothetical protein